MAALASAVNSFTLLSAATDVVSAAWVSVAALSAFCLSSADFFAVVKSFVAAAAAACLTATSLLAASNRIVKVGGFAASDRSSLASAAFHSFTLPSQSPASTLLPSCVNAERRAGSLKAGNDFCAAPSEAQVFTVLSRPELTRRPSCAIRTQNAPPACAAQDLIALPSFNSHSLTVPSSPALASSSESGRQLTSNTAPVWPRRFCTSRAVSASQTNNPPLRSAVASDLPSGLNSAA